MCVGGLTKLSCAWRSSQCGASASDGTDNPNSKIMVARRSAQCELLHTFRLFVKLILDASQLIHRLVWYEGAKPPLGSWAYPVVGFRRFRVSDRH